MPAMSNRYANNNEHTGVMLSRRRPEGGLVILSFCHRPPGGEFRRHFRGFSGRGAGVPERHGGPQANLVRLLDLWSADWKHRGRTRAVGPGAYERAVRNAGLFGHGGVVGVSNATGLREACAAVNGFL